MPREFGREERVADFIQRELSVRVRTDVRDPRLGNVSVTGVRVTRDIGWADVRFSVLGGLEPDGRRDAERILNGAAGFLRTQLARESTMRTIPRLRFHYDEGLEESFRISGLIDRARADDESRRGDGEPD